MRPCKSSLELSSAVAMAMAEATMQTRKERAGEIFMVLECTESENDVVPNLKKIYELQLLVLESTNKANTLRTFLLVPALCSV